VTELIRKIPGFRSNKWWKKLIALAFYLFVLLPFLVAILSPSSLTLALDKIEPTNKSSLTISGKTLVNKPVYLFKDNQEIQTITADSKGQFYFPLNDLTDGNYSYTIKACNSDKQDKCKTENILIVVDQTPPSQPLIALPGALPDDSADKITITGTAEPNTKIVAQLNEDKTEEATTNSQGEFSLETNLAVGGNTISIKSLDQVGNESKAVVSTLNFNPKKYTAKVARVVDGDTIKLESGETLRYIGIDTPETVHPSKPVQCYGKEASAKNKELVEGKEVKLEKDVSEKDKYGRLLRYVWLGDVLVNELLVSKGYAQSSSYPPDVKYQDRFIEAQRLAREENMGLWGDTCNATTTTAAPTTQAQPVQSTQPAVQTSGAYTCNCSKSCSQISSCDEAYYQLNTCGCSARDGDQDGVPCESLCSGGATTSTQTTQTQPVPVQPTQQPTTQTSGTYTCNCSKTCPQMSSCAEAQYQLNTCGCKARDADKDGIACDSDCQ
jgi:micrococcal nuclease